MITADQYFHDKPHTLKHGLSADELLKRVNALLAFAATCSAYTYPIDIDTMTQISGSRGGSGDGGFRLSNAATGAAKSSHKEARGVDVFDPNEVLDNWLTDNVLSEYGLYREHPDHTPGWCHLSTRPPGSSLRTFRIK